MRLDFAETRLDLHTKATGGYAFRNTIHRLSNSLQERRICTNPIPMFKGALTKLVLTECDLDYFTAFFNARRGKTQGFRYKFWADYRTTATQNSLIEGYSIGTVIPESSGQVSFQMCKKYVSEGQETIKPLHKIVPGSVTEVRVNDSILYGGFDVNYSTGVITFSSSYDPTQITFTCQFDIPVRFDIDRLPAIVELIDPQSERLCYSFSQIPLVEIPMFNIIDQPQQYGS